MVEVSPAARGEAEEKANSNKVVLRLLRSGDGELIRELVTIDPTHFYAAEEDMPRHCASPEAIQQWISGHTEAGKPYTSYKFGIWSPDQLVGCIGYKDHLYNFPELWYWVGAPYLRQGFVTAAIRTLTWDLFRRGTTQVDAWTREHNVASQGALVKSGFRQGECWDTLNGRFIKFSASAGMVGACALQ